MVQGNVLEATSKVKLGGLGKDAKAVGEARASCYYYKLRRPWSGRRDPMNTILLRTAAGCGLVALFLAADSARGEEVAMSTQTNRIVHKALGGGRWFPGTRKDLEAMVAGCIRGADVPAVGGRIVGVIAPHAGYVYSGKVAGHTFRAVQDNAAKGAQPETVVVLGFSHRMGFPGVALMDGDAIETPLGEAKLDQEAAAVLMAGRPSIAFDYTPHAGEHSAENEIPFVQVALPGAKLVVAIVGDHEPKTLRDLVAGLNDVAKTKRILVVASSDMLHDPDYSLVTKTDKATLEKVKAMDSQAVLRTWDYSKQVFCGIAPVLAVMQFSQAQGCKTAHVLRYRNSGDDFPESRGEWVVGYGAVAFAAPGDN